MIYGEACEFPTTALDQIRKSQFVFRLTGSRYFKTSTPESDWDFFIKDSPEVRKYLSDRDFVIDSESYSGDPLFTCVLKKENVHVQLVNDEKAKWWVQHCIQQLIGNLEAFKDKENAKVLWRVAMKLYMDGMHRGEHPQS